MSLVKNVSRMKNAFLFKIGPMQIQFLNGPSAGQAIPIDKPSVTFGRTAASNITLDWDPLVSSRHFEIARLEHGVFFRDLGSRNGSRINGLSVDQQALRDGDVIEVGHCKLQIILASSPSTPTSEQLSSEGQARAAHHSTENPYLNPDYQQEAAPTPSSPFSVNPVSKEFASEGRKPFNPLEDSIVIPAADDSARPDDRKSGNQHSDGNRFKSQGSTSVSQPALVTAQPSPTPGKLQSQQPTQAASVYSVVQCPSGLIALTGLDSQLFPSEAIIELLATFGKPYLLVDLSRCECDLPEGVNLTNCQLLRWLPNEVAARSPHLFSINELVQWREYARNTVGRDGLVVLLSQSEKSPLLSHLQKLLRADPSEQGGNPSRGMLGFCWPSVMKACLDSGADGFSATLFQQVQLVMVETNDGAAYSIFASDTDWIEQLKRGLNLAEST